MSPHRRGEYRGHPLTWNIFSCFVLIHIISFASVHPLLSFACTSLPSPGLLLKHIQIYFEALISRDERLRRCFWDLANISSSCTSVPSFFVTPCSIFFSGWAHGSCCRWPRWGRADPSNECRGRRQARSGCVSSWEVRLCMSNPAPLRWRIQWCPLPLFIF